MELNLCEDCHCSMEKHQMFGLVVRGYKLRRLCPRCYTKTHQKLIETQEFTLKEKAMAKLLTGFSEKDLKQQLKLWSKNQVNRL